MNLKDFLAALARYAAEIAYTAGVGRDPSTSNSERLKENVGLGDSETFFRANSTLFRSARQSQV